MKLFFMASCFAVAMVIGSWVGFLTGRSNQVVYAQKVPVKHMKLQILKDNYTGPLTVRVISVSKDRIQENIINYTLENGLKGQAYLEKGDSYYVEN